MPDRPKLLPIRPVYKAPPRASTTARGYGYAHQQLRKLILSKRPVCEVCEKAFATDLHHVDENPHNTTPDNLVATCERCHHSVLHGNG